MFQFRIRASSKNLVFDVNFLPLGLLYPGVKDLTQVGIFDVSWCILLHVAQARHSGNLLNIHIIS